MGHIMPELILRRIIEIGISELRRGDRANFNNVFNTFLQPTISHIFGQEQLDKVYAWFQSVKLPVVMAWSFNPARIPMYSIHLASETEDETKAAVGDYRGGAGFSAIGDEDPESEHEEKIGVFTVMLDIGVHASRSADDVLWMYYILNYILFNKKRELEALGLELQTFSATDYNREEKYQGDNIWTRWIRYRCTIENTYRGTQAIEPEDIEVEVNYEQIKTSTDDS
jgi:hypothetical protein